jgi:type VI secretion system secreted protein Hcp
VERADHGDVYVQKQLDKTSPKLTLLCHQGKHIKEVLLDFCRASEPKVKYLQIKMNEVIISEVSLNGSAQAEGGFPTERVGFNYGKIDWTYTQQKRSDGSGGGQVNSKIDLETQTSS